MSELDDRKVFVEVVRLGSFTSAAALLGISVSYASRRVRALEDRLGVQLLVRSTRRLQPTEAGKTYYPTIRALLEAVDEADQVAGSVAVCPSGDLRVAAPLSFGLAQVVPVLVEFQRTWPKVRLEVGFSDRRTDPLDWDVTIRGGMLEDSALNARKLCPMSAWVAASPAYFDRRGRPAHPDELLTHDRLGYTGSSTTGPWRFVRGDELASVEPVFQLRSDSGDALREFACAGLGVIYQPSFLLEEAVGDGRLERVLPDWQGFVGAFWTLTPNRRQTAATRELIALLHQRLGSG